MYKGEIIMKKQMVKILALIMVVIALMPMAACSSGLAATPENSYVISVYKEIKTQDEYGAVETSDYELWQSFNVIKTQMYDLPGKDDIYLPYFNYGYGEEKYIYNYDISGTLYKTDKGIKVLPSGDTTIFVRERQKKNIRFFINGENIYDKLSEENKLSFKNYYYGTYEEEIYVNGIDTYVSEILGYSMDISDLKFYIGNQRERELIKYNSSSYYGGNYITLIKSTDVNIVIE